MMRWTLAAALSLAACQAQTPNGTNAAETPATQAPAGNAAAANPDAPVSSDDPSPPAAGTSAQPSSDCPITGSSDWSAWINAMPGPGSRPTLIATGKVTVPTGGYRIAWGDLRVAESYPVQIFADLRVTPPSGAATQVVSTHEVRGEWPMDQPVGSFTVRCGNRVLARVSPVERAQ